MLEVNHMRAKASKFDGLQDLVSRLKSSSGSAIPVRQI